MVTTEQQAEARKGLLQLTGDLARIAGRFDDDLLWETPSQITTDEVVAFIREIFPLVRQKGEFEPGMYRRIMLDDAFKMLGEAPLEEGE